MPANFSATARACLCSQASSPTSSLSFLPSTPPAALMSATACSAPFLSCRPKVASPPDIGPATPIVSSWAVAVPPSVIVAASARPASHILLMLFSSKKRTADPNGRPGRVIFPGVILSGFWRKSPGNRAGAIGFFDPRPPGELARELVEPIILRRHLGGPRYPPRQRPDQEQIERIGGIGGGRQQRALEQRKVDEAHGSAEQHHVD